MLRAAGRFLGAWMLCGLPGRRGPGSAAARSWRASPSAWPAGGLGGLSAARFRPVHVRDLPDHQLQRHQLRRRRADHGAAAGVILFFTCLSAVLAPLAMGAVSDAMGHKVRLLARDRLCGLLFAGLLLNWLTNPTRAVLERLNLADYKQELT